MASAVIIFSGGQDSTTCLYWALARGWDVHAITFNYGQRHKKEIAAATRIIYRLRGEVVHEVVELKNILFGTSPLISGLELEQYKDRDSLPGGLEKTFVPIRNQLFLTIAANRAYVLNTPNIVTGISQEDYGGYPDCRQEFIKLFEQVSMAGTFTGEGGPSWLKVYTPLMHKSKAESVRMSLTLPGCYEALAFTHTSYDNAYPPTGHDHATLLREKGFYEAMVPDPLVLRAVLEGLMPMPETPNYKSDESTVVDCKFRIAELMEGFNV